MIIFYKFLKLKFHEIRQNHGGIANYLVVKNVYFVQFL